jgi:hypothetical protein
MDSSSSVSRGQIGSCVLTLPLGVIHFGKCSFRPLGNLPVLAEGATQVAPYRGNGISGRAWIEMVQWL